MGRNPWIRLTASRRPEDLVIAEFDDSVAIGAMQVIVRGVTVIVLERGAIGQAELAEQARLDQYSQCPIDRCAADPLPGIVQLADQLIGIEVLVGVEDVVDQHATTAFNFSPRISRNSRNFSTGELETMRGVN